MSLLPELVFVHIDPTFVVVNKPSGLLSVPGRGPENKDCITERVKQHFPSCIDQPAVHRLDMDTSGLLVLGLTRKSHRTLSISFEKRRVKKRYIALLDGIVDKEEGRIELPFRLDIDHRPYQIYDPVHGKIGITLWRKLSVEDNHTRIEFNPLTGKTHQLRVHSANPHGLGIPIVGDVLYGSGKKHGRLMLHASFLSFPHPESGHQLEFESPSPF